MLQIPNNSMKCCLAPTRPNYLALVPQSPCITFCILGLLKRKYNIFILKSFLTCSYVYSGFYTNSGTAQPGRDYVSKDTQLFFGQGETLHHVYVELLPFDGEEDEEFFTVHLTDPEGGDSRICDGVSTVNIKDITIVESKSNTLSFNLIEKYILREELTTNLVDVKPVTKTRVATSFPCFSLLIM